MAFHCFPEEFQCRHAITALCDKAFQDFTFVITSPLMIVHRAVNLDEYLVQVPLQVRIYVHLADPFLADLSGKHRAKSVLPKSNRLVADIDAPFVQQILHISKRQRETDIHHHRQTDDLGARLEVAKGAAFCHQKKLSARPARPNKFSSDNAPTRGHHSFGRLPR